MKKSSCVRYKSCCALIFLCSLLFTGCGESAKIDELSEKLDGLGQKIVEINERVDGQTSIINRVIGEHIPVVIPETQKALFSNLRESVEILKSDVNESNLEKSISLYMEFIKTVAPWIQEELSNNLLQIKYDLDYYSIIVNYSQEDNFSDYIDAMQSFIASSTDYESLNNVVNFYNNLVEKETKVYEENFKAFTKKVDVDLSNKKITTETLKALIKESEIYAENADFSEYIEKLNLYAEEASLRDSLIEGISDLKAQINSTDEYNLKEELYFLYKSQLAQIVSSVNVISFLDTADILSEIEECAKELSACKTQVEIVQEKELLEQIDNSLENCKAEISQITNDVTCASMITLLASQLASLKYETDSIKHIDVSEVKNRIDVCVSLLNTKEKAIENSKSEQDDSIRNYNSRSLDFINRIKRDFDAIGIFDSDKNAKKVKYLSDLELLQVQYLYQPIASIYQELYQQIWSGLDADSKLEVARKSINAKKKDLNEYF